MISATEKDSPTTVGVPIGLLQRHLIIYEENENRERERRDQDATISKLLDGIGLRGGAPQW